MFSYWEIAQFHLVTKMNPKFPLSPEAPRGGYPIIARLSERRAWPFLPRSLTQTIVITVCVHVIIISCIFFYWYKKTRSIFFLSLKISKDNGPAVSFNFSMGRFLSVIVSEDNGPIVSFYCLSFRFLSVTFSMHTGPTVFFSFLRLTLISAIVSRDNGLIISLNFLRFLYISVTISKGNGATISFNFIMFWAIKIPSQSREELYLPIYRKIYHYNRICFCLGCQTNTVPQSTNYFEYSANTEYVFLSSSNMFPKSRLL